MKEQEKQKERTIKDEIRDSFKYRWEFVRRNENYKKDNKAWESFHETSEDVAKSPLPQIGFLKKGRDEYDYFLLDEIPEESSIEDGKYDLDNQEGFRTFVCESEKAQQILQEKGFKFKFGGYKDPPEGLPDRLLCEIEATVDDVILRAMAKIAFNYFTYWQDADFVMHEDFNSIRNFIKKGNRGTYPLVKPSNEPILGDEACEGRRRVGRIVTVNYAKDNKSIVAQVSLSNWLKYSISLARDFSGERRDIKRGHFLNIPTQEIIDLGTD